MNTEELKDIISEGESSTVEFKRKISSLQKISKEISAFANTKGGLIIIGVDDDGTIVGVSSEKEEIDQIITACNFHIIPPVEPSFDIISLKKKDILIVYINESDNKPHKIIEENPDTKKPIKRAYIRVGESSVIASREMTRLLAAQNANSKPLTISFGDKEKRLFAYLEKNEKTTVKEFAKIVNISSRRAERLLISLVRAGVLQIHSDTNHDYFTLV